MRTHTKLNLGLKMFKSRKNQNYLQAIIALAISTLLISCASNPPPRIDDVLLPEIDVIQVKENSDEALKISRETKLDIEAINTKSHVSFR